jgi:hypothetical protein
VFWLLKAPTAESPHARLAGHKHLSRSDYLAVGLSWAGIISCQPRINKPRLINCGSARSSKWLVKWYPPIQQPRGFLIRGWHYMKPHMHT